MFKKKKKFKNGKIMETIDKTSMHSDGSVICQCGSRVPAYVAIDNWTIIEHSGIREFNCVKCRINNKGI